MAPNTLKAPVSSGGRLTDFCCVPQTILAASLRISASAYVNSSW